MGYYWRAQSPVSDEMSDAAAKEIQAIIGKRVSLLDAIALINIMCFSTLVLPSGVTLNGPDDEPMGREEAAGILAPLTKELEPIDLKAAYDAKSTLYPGPELLQSWKDWVNEIEALGIQITQW